MVARKLHRAFGYGELRPEFLRLVKRARGELPPGDAIRKAHIVLDFRAGAGLSPRSNGFQDQYVQSLRTRVHRRRETGRTGAYNDDVPHLIEIDRVVEPQAVRYLLVGRIAKYNLSPADHDGNVPFADVKAVEESLNVVFLV